MDNMEKDVAALQKRVEALEKQAHTLSMFLAKALAALPKGAIGNLGAEVMGPANDGRLSQVLANAIKR